MEDQTLFSGGEMYLKWIFQKGSTDFGFELDIK